MENNTLPLLNYSFWSLLLIIFLVWKHHMVFHIYSDPFFSFFNRLLILQKGWSVPPININLFKLLRVHPNQDFLSYSSVISSILCIMDTRNDGILCFLALIRDHIRFFYVNFFLVTWFVL